MCSVFHLWKVNKNVWKMLFSIIMTIQFIVKKTTFYDEFSFLKIIGDAF